MPNISRWGFTDGVKLAQTVGKELSNPSNYTTEEFISAAKCALLKYPSEWVIYFSLGDKYQESGYYAEGLRATQKCVQLRPNDIRSTYALATSYNILTRAAWTKSEEEVVNIVKALINDIDKADSRYSQAGLDHTGMALETAAVQAIRWFERSLELKPDSDSRFQINSDLGTLFKRFPHLYR